MVHSCRSTLFLTERLTDQSAARARGATHGISFARSRDRAKRRSQLLLGAAGDTAIVGGTSESSSSGNVSAGSNRSRDSQRLGRGLSRFIPRRIAIAFDCTRARTVPPRFPPLNDQYKRLPDRALLDWIYTSVRYDIQFDLISTCRASHPWRLQ